MANKVLMTNRKPTKLLFCIFLGLIITRSYIYHFVTGEFNLVNNSIIWVYCFFLFSLLSSFLIHRTQFAISIIKFKSLSIISTTLFSILIMLMLNRKNLFFAIDVFMFDTLIVSLILLTLLPFIFRSIKYIETYTNLSVYKTSWTRREAFILIVALITAIVTRIIAIPQTAQAIHGDDYLTGVFAINLLNGLPSLYFGDHTGTLSAYLVAPLILFFGSSLTTLLALPIILTCVLMFCQFQIARLLFGFWGGLGTLIWMAVPSATVLLWTSKPQPGYIESLTFISLALWWLIRFTWQDPEQKPKVLLLLGAVTSASLAVWSGFVIAPLLLCCIYIFITSWRRFSQLPFWIYFIILLIPIIIWFAPALLYSLGRPGNNPFWYAFGAERPQPQPQIAFVRLFDTLYPILLGARRPIGRDDVPVLVQVFLISSIVLGSSTILWHIFYLRRMSAMIIPVTFVSAITVFVFTSFGLVFSDVRYMVPLYAILPIVFGAFVKSVRETRYGRILASATLLIAVCCNIVSAFGDFKSPQDLQDRDIVKLTNEMKSKDITAIYTSYWIGMGVMYESDGKISASVRVGPTRVSYDERNDARAESTEHDKTAFVFLSNGSAQPIFLKYITESSITCSRAEAGKYVYYYHCTPFPDIKSLVDKIPANYTE